MALYKYSNDLSSRLPLSNNLYARLQADILTNKIAAGEKLTEQRLCKEYDVSRTPVREALRQLETHGLVENIPNRGAFAVGFSEQDFKDMFDLRKSCEIQAVKWAIERITDEEIHALEEIFEFMEFYTIKNDILKMDNINSKFQQIIYNASHNRLLARTLSTYQTYTKYMGRGRQQSENYLSVLLEEHRKIFKAFTEKDMKAGTQAMSIHIANSKLRQCKT